MRGKRCKGSVTVEAAILVPFIILCIIIVIYIGFLLYQRALLQSAVDEAARAGAASWRSVSADIATGKNEIDGTNDAGLYWRLVETGRDSKLNVIKKYLADNLKKRNVLIPSSSNVDIELENCIIYKRLKVIAKNSYSLPVSGMLRKFGFDGCITLNVQSYANINDSTEIIRNADLILEIEKELENKYEGIKGFGDKTREVFGVIKGNIDKFLE